jgi:hypothetical protein
MPSHRTRTICRAIVLIFFAQWWTTGAFAQNLKPGTPAGLLSTNSSPAADVSPAHFKELERPSLRANRKKFIAMSLAVYGLAFLDMHETMSLEPGLVEHDPLARPFTKLPQPAFYLTGAAMSTGVNFVAWKLGRSPKWHKMWWVPQAACAYGNIYGYGTTKARE